MRGALEKYMLKSGKDKKEIDGVLKSAGQKHGKIKIAGGKHDIANGDEAVEKPKKGKTKSLTKVASDGGKPGSMVNQGEFGKDYL